MAQRDWGGVLWSLSWWTEDSEVQHFLSDESPCSFYVALGAGLLVQGQGN